MGFVIPLLLAFWLGLLALVLGAATSDIYMAQVGFSMMGIVGLIVSGIGIVALILGRPKV